MGLQTSQCELCSWCPCSSQAAHAHSCLGLDETVHGLLRQLKCQILTFSYWDSFTLKYKIFKPGFKQDLLQPFLKIQSFLSSYFPLCYAFSCWELQGVCLCSSHRFLLFLSALLPLPALGGLSFPWNSSNISRGHYCLRLPGLGVLPVVPYSIPYSAWRLSLSRLCGDQKTKTTWVDNPTGVSDPRTKAPDERLGYKYHSHTLHLLSVWRNVSINLAIRVSSEESDVYSSEGFAWTFFMR